MKTKRLTVFLFLMATSTQLLARPSLGGLDQKLNDLVHCPSNAPTRFVDNGNGTVCDRQTGLMWEKKNALDGVQNFQNPSDADNTYRLVNSSTAFDIFLPLLNGEAIYSGNVNTTNHNPVQLGGYNDWRLPTAGELQTIMACSFTGTCPDVFNLVNPVLGPTAATANYWSSTILIEAPSEGVYLDISVGQLRETPRHRTLHVRAVRNGR